MNKTPLVLDVNAEIQQLQQGDTLTDDLSLQGQINKLRSLLSKLVLNQINLGLPIEDPDLLELLNNV